MRTRATLLLSAVAVVLLAACAGMAAGVGGAYDANFISNDEVRESDARDGYELVQRLRPRWLRARPDRSQRLDTQKLVYMDNSRLGGLEELRGIALEMIYAVRYLDAARAGQLPGLGADHTEGVIQILTRPD